MTEDEQLKMEEEIEDEVIKANQAELMRYGNIFYQLLQRPWFKEMMEINVDIQTFIDHEKKEIVDRILEVPFEEKAKRAAAIEKRKRDAGPQIVAPSATEMITFNKGAK